MKKGTIIIIVLVVIAVIFGGLVFGNYNKMAVARENVDTMTSAIDAQLQRRSDLIPNLVNTVKGLSNQEKSLIDSVTEARARLAGAQTMSEKSEANQSLSNALSRLLMVVENYPDIKSSAAYISLMDELSGTENRIAVARTDYNAAVKEYNSKLIIFPGNLVAGIFGFDKADYFQAAEGAENAPEVQFPE